MRLPELPARDEDEQVMLEVIVLSLCADLESGTITRLLMARPDGAGATDNLYRRD
jgi:hypothetical protein